MHEPFELLQREPAPPTIGHHTSFDQKMDDARRYQRDESIPWPVLVDDLDGRVHQAYGCVADPSYLIDVDGRVAYYNIVTSAAGNESCLPKTAIG